jgi:hypothetical protein
LPSPRKKASKTDVVISDLIPERIVLTSDDLQIHHVEPYNPLEPLSPDSLARRLGALSSGYEVNSPPFLDDSTITDSETSSPNFGEVVFTQTSSSTSITQPITMHPQYDSDDRAQIALRDGIRSLYQFWKLSKPDTPIDQEKTLFLSTLHQIIDQL